MLSAILAGFFGLLIGSFLNVCVYRLPRDLSVVRPRSFCPECGKGIAWYDNIPVLSYLILRGRCRACRAAIPVRYPLVELLTGVAFFTAFWMYGPGVEGVKICAFAAILIELIFSDLETRILPNEFTLGGVAVGIAFSWFVPIPGGIVQLFLPRAMSPNLASTVEAIAGALLAGGALWLVARIYHAVRHREGLGEGDIRMVAMMGAFLGVEGVLLALIVGSLLGSVVGLAYILLTSKDAGSYELPFGTFLGVGALVLGLFGGSILSWYAHF